MSNNPTAKEKNPLTVLEVVQEMYARDLIEKWIYINRIVINFHRRKWHNTPLDLRWSRDTAAKKELKKNIAKFICGRSYI